MMRQGGMANGRSIVPEAWVRDTIEAGGNFEAWQRGTMAFLLPRGRYRNKWYQTGMESGAFFGLGIHGQWLYVNPKAEVVIAKMSSQPLPVDDPLDQDMIAFFETLSRMV
jgi:CubicO group peptidase (beta-lactamase class C family)